MNHVMLLHLILLYFLSFRMHVNSLTFIRRVTWTRRRKLHSSFSRTCITMMPEGPEVKTLVDQLQPAVGKRLVNFQVLSGRYSRMTPRGFNEFWSTISPQDNITKVDIVQQLSCKGKFMFIVLDDGRPQNIQTNGESTDYLRSIWITLGMTGYFMNDHGGENSHSRWFMEFLDMTRNLSRRIYFQDPRSFGTIRFSLSRKELMDKLSCLGPDVLDNEFSEEAFLNRLSSKSMELNICKALMDQSNISGIGNYILSESLYRAHVDPFASINELSQAQLSSLFREIKSVCRESYNAQRPTKAGDPPNIPFVLQCYGRSECIQGKKVIREGDGPHGRTIWYVQDQLLIPRDDRKRLLSSGRFIDQEISSILHKENVTGQSNSVQLKDESISNYLVDDGWRKMLFSYWNTSEFRKIDQFVLSELRSSTIYPPKREIFAALNQCPFEKVKVVIIGQDPYHGPGQGHGLAFSVRRGIKIPPSLMNIYKELSSDLNIPVPKHGNLDSWAEQGVLLLNTVLTVRAGLANSHAGKGWENFSDEIVRLLNFSKDGLVFLLWGSQASIKASSVDPHRHIVISTSHPSPLGSTKTSSPFIGSKCFSRCNDALVRFGKEPIKWEIV